MLVFLRKHVLIIGALAFALALNGYIYFQQSFLKNLFADKSKLSESCPDPSAQSQVQNPNKTLFISCGGFLD